MISINYTCENEHPLYCRSKNIYRVNIESEYRILALYQETYNIIKITNINWISRI